MEHNSHLYSNHKEFFQFYKFVSWVAGTPFTPIYKKGS